MLNHTFAQLDAAFAEQARFTSDAAHELRTPVSVILAQTQLALARPRGAEEYRESIETTRRSALRMQSLIESLLTLARLDARADRRTGSRATSPPIGREQIDLIRPLAAERGITLRARPGARRLRRRPRARGADLHQPAFQRREIQPPRRRGACCPPAA